MKLFDFIRIFFPIEIKVLQIIKQQTFLFILTLLYHIFMSLISITSHFIPFLQGKISFCHQIPFSTKNNSNFFHLK